jgi:hypothetical protein
MTDLEHLTKTWLTYSQDTMCIPADILTDFECGERNAIGLVRPLIAALEQRVQKVERERDAKLQQAEQALAAVERERDRLRGAILTHVASAIGDPLETGQAYAAFLARYDAAHTEEAGDAD